MPPRSIRPSSEVGSGPVVAIDVTPLVIPRTGIGQSVEGMWSAVRGMPGGPTLAPYVLGLRSPSRLAGSSEALVNVRVSTRLLLAAWSRTRWPSLDSWIRNADVVHATNFVTPPSHLPTVTTVHDVGFVLDPSAANRVVARFEPILRQAVERGAHIHVPTHQVASEVDEQFGPGLISEGRVTVVPFGVPPLSDHRPLRPDLDAAIAGRPYVLAIGTAERRKNLPRLISAFGVVASRHRSLLLVLAGQHGPDSQAMDAAVGLLPADISDRVLRLGPVSQDSRAALLAGASVLAYPSLYEGFGFPPLEAMQCGVPVLASNSGAVLEIAGPAAELVDPTDTDAIAEGLERLVDDDELRLSLVERGRSHVAGFTWERTAIGLSQIYERLAASR